MAVHTMRGRVPAGGFDRLVADDGQFTQGHLVKSVHIIGANNGSIGAIGVLSRTADVVASINMDDSQQIAWSIWDADTTTGNRLITVIDHEQVVSQELFIHGVSGAFDYIVELEPITMTENQGVLQLVKAKRQG